MSDVKNPQFTAVELLKCASVTPDDGGSLALMSQWLKPYGFGSTPLTFDLKPGETYAVPNLFARRGTSGRHFAFAGHVDVVPPGDTAAWTHPPFASEIKEGVLYGRGAVDMKGAVACMVSAVARFLDKRPDFAESISFIITADEEAVALNGTKPLVEWMDKNGHTPDHCLLGEPTNPKEFGDAIKIGRRGIMSGELKVVGTQGHVAYPHLANNPLRALRPLMDAMDSLPLDQGTEHFQASNLEIVSIDTGNPAFNVIPAHVTARFNVRFNDTHTVESLQKLLRERVAKAAEGRNISYELTFIEPFSDAFLTSPGPFVDTVVSAIKDITGRTPSLSTAGGSSDARFIKNYCPVLEFGLVGQTMHKVDECVPLRDLETLTDVYVRVLERYFA